MRLPLLALMLGTGLTLSVPGQAHITKEFDRNGGHWDDAGNYHCHLDGCVPTVSRWQYRSRVFNNNSRDMDLYYVEEDWPHWELIAGCKTARTVTLANTSRIPVTWTNPRQCEIREGLWVDEYTGKEYTRAAQLEIDHIIPPQYANSSNGYQWDLGVRIQFANDPFNLIPVGRDTYRKKRQRSIASWRPGDDFLCEYAEAWNNVAKKYDLDLFARDTSRINRILEDCQTTEGTGVDEE